MRTHIVFLDLGTRRKDLHFHFADAITSVSTLPTVEASGRGTSFPARVQYSFSPGKKGKKHSGCDSAIIDFCEEIFEEKNSELG